MSRKEEKVNNINLAIDMIRKIGIMLVQKQKNVSPARLSYKEGKEVVSNYDIVTEKKIRKDIHSLFPNHKIWGEELGRDVGNLENERFIIIDPIDGTKNFLSGLPLFASQIACVEEGKIVWGIINLPALSEIYWAIEGKGAYRNGKRIYPSKQDSLDLAMQCFGIGHNAENFLTLPNIIRNQLAEPRHYGCAGVHYSFVACGRVDIYIAAEAKYYDMAAGLLLCKEAGLSFCNLQGGRFRFNENDTSVVIANRKLINLYKKIVKGP